MKFFPVKKYRRIAPNEIIENIIKSFTIEGKLLQSSQISIRIEKFLNGRIVFTLK